TMSTDASLYQGRQEGLMRVFLMLDGANAATRSRLTPVMIKVCVLVIYGLKIVTATMEATDTTVHVRELRKWKPPAKIRRNMKAANARHASRSMSISQPAAMMSRNVRVLLNRPTRANFMTGMLAVSSSLA